MKEDYSDSNNHRLKEYGIYRLSSELNPSEFHPGQVLRINNEYFIRYKNRPLQKIYPNNPEEVNLKAQDLTEIRSGTLAWLLANTSHAHFLKNLKRGRSRKALNTI